MFLSLFNILISLLFLEITGVYPNVGSPEGGTLITIYGNYFYDTSGEIEAFVSGTNLLSNVFKLYLFLCL